jgi:hypothetical protein
MTDTTSVVHKDSLWYRRLIVLAVYAWLVSSWFWADSQAVWLIVLVAAALAAVRIALGIVAFRRGGRSSGWALAEFLLWNWPVIA